MRMFLGKQEIQLTGRWFFRTLNVKAHADIKKFLRHYKPSKHQDVIDFLENKGGICDWTEKDLTPELEKKLGAAIEDGIVASYCETETYMLEIE